MKLITDGIASLDLSMQMGGRQMEIHPTLVWDDKNVVLIDTGFPGMITDNLAEIEQAGVPFEKRSKVGSLADMKRCALSSATVIKNAIAH